MLKPTIAAIALALAATGTMQPTTPKAQTPEIERVALSAVSAPVQITATKTPIKPVVAPVKIAPKAKAAKPAAAKPASAPAFMIERAGFTAKKKAKPKAKQVSGTQSRYAKKIVLAEQAETKAKKLAGTSRYTHKVALATEAETRAKSVTQTGASITPIKATGAGSAVVAEARKYLGVPYVWGGTSPTNGLDCSGLVQLVFRNLGVDLPRVARQQATVGTRIASLSQAKPGDLLGMRNGTHIAIYIGGNQILHSPRPGETVSIRSLTSYDDIDTIRRVL